MTWKRVRDRGPIWLLAAVAVWHAALGITALGAVVIGWSTEFLDFGVEHTLWAFACAYVAFLMHENQRLTRLADQPAWRIADKAWGEGYAAAKGDRHE